MRKGFCILTGEEVSIKDHLDFESYSLTILDRTVHISLCLNCKSSFSEMPHHIFKSLIVNNIWPERALLISKACSRKDYDDFVDTEKIILENYLASTIYPKTPTERLNSLFMFIFSQQQIDGQSIRFDADEKKTWMKNYFVNGNECFFYLQGLEEQGLIKLIRLNSEYEVSITHKGLNYAIEIEKVGIQSNSCFLAMAFDEKANMYREAIRNAVKKAGFELVVIDEQNIESDRTIPDAILLAIKRSKFCIADFTFHKNGVYFECGYALGLGKPIIYTCQKEEFEKAHFDIKQLQHIIYKDQNELESKLRDKIEAWIK